jgi:serine/threonine-protein kinase
VTDTLDIRRALMQCGECKQRFGAEATFCPFDGTKLDATVWDSAGDPLIGKVIDGRYEVHGVLGEGGMGTVYKVRHVALDRVFALKALRRDLARDPDLSSRFMREARATAMVKHPNVVAITDFGVLNTATVPGTEGFMPDIGIPYFVMEHLSGETLARTLHAGGVLPSALAVKIILQVASALEAAHEAKIVHRDLKPDNVFLLGRPGQDTDVRVVDFGAAMILGASRNTKTGIVFGTPHYMSPEQASGQPVDHRADIYALGVIMYEVFTGRVPFLADTYMGVLTQHMFVKPTPPSQVSERARELGALEDVVLRALEKKPEQRFPTMSALAAEVQRVTSFGPDGSFRVAKSSGVPSRPVFQLANQLELPSREEVAVITRTTTRRRRGRARAWVVYAGVALGVATVALTAQRLLSAHANEVAHSAVAPPPPSPAVIAPAPQPSAAAPPPSPSVVPTPLPSAAATAPPSPSTRSASRSRPAASAAPKKPVDSMSTDFADPWSRSK